MSLVGVDLNSSRLRAVAGPALQRLARVALETDQAELPLVVNLAEHPPRVGRSGLSQFRLRPHLVCADYLPYLGSSKQWCGGRNRLDAEAALSLVWQALARVLGRSSGVALVLPSYLNELQVAQVHRLAEAAGLQVLGSLSTPLAAVLGQGGQLAEGLYLVVDADGHALTWSVVERTANQLRMRLVQPGTSLARGVWIRRLLEGVAGRCVRNIRRDPRESAETEQRLFEQLLGVIESEREGLIQLHIQGGGWYHHLMLHTDELNYFVASSLRQLLQEAEAIRCSLETLGRPPRILITPSAAGLPGLVEGLRRQLVCRAAADEPAVYDGSALGGSDVQVLAPDLLAGVAHQLGVRMHSGELPRGHLDAVALPSLPGSQAEQGPPRLAYAGHDHVLLASPFTLGRDPACHLVFATEKYPCVSARHCDIVQDQRRYLLLDRSRHGTLLNDRPVQQAPLISGDWIRLGPTGPVLRFLGQTSEQGHRSVSSLR